MEMSGAGLRPRVSILSLDLSLTATGFCLDGAVGVIRSRLGGYERNAEIRDAIARMCFGVDLVVMEDYAYSVNMRGVAPRHELGGIIKMWCYDHRLTVVSLSPTTLKKFATGSGKAQKINMAQAAWRRFHLGEQHTDDNVIDAYLLWCAAREAYGGQVAKVPAIQAACIHRLEWPRVGRDAA